MALFGKKARQNREKFTNGASGVLHRVVARDARVLKGKKTCNFLNDFGQKPAGVYGMGGPGSGMWYRWDTRTTLDQVHQLDVRWLHRHGYLDHLSRWVTWSRGERQTGSVGVRLVDGCLVVEYRCRQRGTDAWEDIRQVITLEWTPCHYGGQRPWFRCPGCQRRVAVLCGDDRLFLCRHCYRLPYTSQYETRLDRLYRKLRKLRDRVGEQYARKPKGMHWRTWERLRDQALDAEMIWDLAREATLDRLMRSG
jgi:hypothetical protein